MQGNQALARKLLFRSEGGYTVDKGGPTMRGVTLTAFRAATRDPHATIEQLKAITEDQAWVIFMDGYLAPIWFDQLPSGVDYMLADFSVNSGPHAAVSHLQRVLVESGEKDLVVDGHMGPKTMAAVLDFEPDAVISAVLDDRLDWMRTLSNWPEAGKGWTNRIAQVRTAALAIAKVPPAKSPPSPAPAAVPPVATKQGGFMFNPLEILGSVASMFEGVAGKADTVIKVGSVAPSIIGGAFKAAPDAIEGVKALVELASDIRGGRWDEVANEDISRVIAAGRKIMIDFGIDHDKLNTAAAKVADIDSVTTLAGKKV